MESADMEEQKYAYRGNDIPTSDFIIALSEPGDYCIEINAKDFRGSYGILNPKPCTGLCLQESMSAVWNL